MERQNSTVPTFQRTPRPLQNKVIVLPDTPLEKTAGGLIIPDTAKKATTTGTVVSVGLGTQDLPMICSVGDRVTYGQFAGTAFEHEGYGLMVLSVISDIIAVI